MGVYRDRKTGKYRYDVMFRRRRYTKRGFKTERAAMDAEHERRQRLVAGRTDPFPTFRLMVGAYLNSGVRRKSAGWSYQEEVKLNKAFPHLADLHPRDITRGHVEPVLDRLCDENSPQSANEYRKIIISVLNYGVKMGALDSNVASGIPRIPENEPDVQPISKGHLIQLILAADNGMRRLLIFLSQTGARFIEAGRLRSGQVLEQPRPVCVLIPHKRRGGGERRRVQPLTQTALNAVRPC